jgi:hypothetical protein
VNPQQFLAAPQSDQLQIGSVALQSEGVCFGSHSVNPQQFLAAPQSGDITIWV